MSDREAALKAALQKVARAVAELTGLTYHQHGRPNGFDHCKCSTCRAHELAEEVENETKDL